MLMNCRSWSCVEHNISAKTVYNLNTNANSDPNKHYSLFPNILLLLAIFTFQMCAATCGHSLLTVIDVIVTYSDLRNELIDDQH